MEQKIWIMVEGPTIPKVADLLKQYGLEGSVRVVPSAHGPQPGLGAMNPTLWELLCLAAKTEGVELVYVAKMPRSEPKETF